MDPMEEIRQTFFTECEELLEALEAGLLSIHDGTHDEETVNVVFRAVHSIKGGAGAFELDALVRFAHGFETTLDEVRSGRLEPGEDVVATLLRSADVLSDLFAAYRDGAVPAEDTAQSLLVELSTLSGAPAPAPAAAPPADDGGFAPVPLALDLEAPAFEPVPLDLGGGDDADAADEAASPLRHYAIRFRPKKDLYRRGGEPTLLLRALDALGELDVAVTGIDAADPAALDPEEPCAEWLIGLKTAADRADIEEVFEFVSDDSDLSIEALLGLEEPQAPQAPQAQEAPASAAPAPEREAVPPPAEAQAEQAAPEPEAASASPAPSQSEGQSKPVVAPKATVRVDLDRVDRLINLVGELVINQAMLTQCVEDSGPMNREVATGLEEFHQLTREIQESVMAIRTQPVKPLLQRMSRIVRESASATGKSVRLRTEGEATEIDKTVLERLADPLTHMIRNAVDHGLESPEKRLEAGKSEEGTVRLTAAHRSGRVVIEVADDGAGINRERVRQIAVDKGLIAADAQLTENEIDNLLFMPGFSTAKEVSNLSGRGVGMDVVKKAIQALGGRIAITSSPGRGTTFSISLPLTLAVLDGMLVRIDDHTVVLPLTAIIETFKLQGGELHRLGQGGHVLSVRGEFVPLVDIGSELGFRDRVEDYEEAVILLIQTEEGVRAAFVADGIDDQQQVVIKGLEDNYGTIEGVAAATILGDGRIALILDADNLVERAALPPGETSAAA
ncbi:chemotaxis protein CheA [Parvularcula oceani]|uniref:chemotaxis protein CheA n=1 Tax=Parvularcula oceani TaxID=1247963 RepID=UPI0004E0F7C5|nr:chemotaxis protein CheA [Parvularcula oceani]